MSRDVIWGGAAGGEFAPPRFLRKNNIPLIKCMNLYLILNKMLLVKLMSIVSKRLQPTDDLLDNEN